MKIGILASGNLGAICLNKCLNNLNPLFIATDSNSTAIIDIATKNKIPLFKGNPRNGKFAAFLSTNTFDIILSINYLFILEEDVISKATYPINFHGGNTRYPGRGGYCHAIYNSEKNYGSVAHLMKKRVDTGKIIKELNFKISPNETVESLKFRTFLISFYLFYDIVLQIYNKNLHFEKKNGKENPINYLI
jgi:methionyl-tRNA formyltransferase